MPHRNGHHLSAAVRPSVGTSEGLLLGLGVLGAALIFLTDVAIPQGIAVPMVYVAIVLIALWSDRKMLTLALAGAGALLTIVGYFLSSTGYSSLAATNRSLVIVVLALTAGLIVLTQQARQELHTLRHFLPRCASCRMIKDERGDWSGMEQFLEQRLDLFFTHGMCQACMEKWYPEMYPELQERHPELFQSQAN